MLSISPDPLGCHRSRYPQSEGWGPTVGCESSRSVDMLVLPGEEVSFPSPFRPISLVKKNKEAVFNAFKVFVLHADAFHDPVFGVDSGWEGA